LSHSIYMSLSTPELVKRCSRRDPAAWTEFLRRYQRPMALAIVRILRNAGPSSPEILDDLLQDTYLRLCANDCALLHTLVLRHQDSLEPVLCVIGINVARDHLRAKMSQKRGGQLQQAPDGNLNVVERAEPEGSATQIERKIQLDEIDRLLQRSPGSASAPRDRRIFWLHFLSGLSSQSISEIPSVGLTAKGVESSIFRTLRYIRKSLQIDRR
jgi:RNA polymerase sigma-70 factor, ECF subfamily